MKTSNNHPWVRAFNNQVKLEKAKEEARLKKNRQYQKNSITTATERYRLRKGQDIEAPIKSNAECLRLANEALKKRKAQQ